MGRSTKKNLVPSKLGSASISPTRLSLFIGSCILTLRLLFQSAQALERDVTVQVRRLIVVTSLPARKTLNHLPVPHGLTVIPMVS